MNQWAAKLAERRNELRRCSTFDELELWRDTTAAHLLRAFEYDQQGQRLASELMGVSFTLAFDEYPSLEELQAQYPPDDSFWYEYDYQGPWHEEFWQKDAKGVYRLTKRGKSQGLSLGADDALKVLQRAIVDVEAKRLVSDEKAEDAPAQGVKNKPDTSISSKGPNPDLEVLRFDLDFGLVEDARWRGKLEKKWLDAQRIGGIGIYDSAVITVASVVEGLLIYLLRDFKTKEDREQFRSALVAAYIRDRTDEDDDQQAKERAAEDFARRCIKKDVALWSLFELFVAAESSFSLTEFTDARLRLVKFRNHVHPNRQFGGDERASEADFLGSLGDVMRFVQAIKRKHPMPWSEGEGSDGNK